MRLIFLSIFMIIIFQAPAGASQDLLGLDSASNLYVVWAEFDGSDNEIYISRRNSAGWTEKEQITDNDTDDFSPCIAVDKKANPWIVWVGNDGFNTAVYSRYWNGESWSRIHQVDSVDLYEETFPSVTIDEKNTPWAVWCGTDGRDDDIYISSWKGSHWAPEKIVNIDDNWPDLTPAITSIPGRKGLFITWMGYNGWNYELYYTFCTSGKIGEERTFGFEKNRSFGECPSFIKFDTGQIQIFWLEKGSYCSTLGDGLNWQDKKALDLAYTDEFLVDLVDKFSAPVWIAWEYRGLRQNFRLLPVSTPKVLTRKQSLGNVVWEQVFNFLEPEVYADVEATKYIAFGDSITEGDELGGYPPKLEDELDENIGASTVINCGVGGERTFEGLDRIDTVLEQYDAQYILIMEGTNDVTFHYSLQEIRFNLGEMIDRSRNYGTTPFLAKLPPRKDSLNNATQRVNRWVIEILHENKNVYMVDQYTQMAEDSEKYLADDKHPNQVGYELMADIWYDAIAAVINPPEEETDDDDGCGSIILPVNRGGGRGINLGMLFIVFMLGLWFRSRLCRS